VTAGTPDGCRTLINSLMFAEHINTNEVLCASLYTATVLQILADTAPFQNYGALLPEPHGFTETVISMHTL